MKKIRKREMFTVIVILAILAIATIGMILLTDSRVSAAIDITNMVDHDCDWNWSHKKKGDEVVCVLSCICGDVAYEATPDWSKKNRYLYIL